MLKDGEILNFSAKKAVLARELLLSVEIIIHKILLLVASAEAMKKLCELGNRLFGRAFDFRLSLLNGLYRLRLLYGLYRLNGLHGLIHSLSRMILSIIGFVY